MQILCCFKVLYKLILIALCIFKLLLLNKAFVLLDGPGVCVVIIFQAADQIGAIIIVDMSLFGRLCGASHPTRSALYQISFLSPALFQLYLSVYCTPGNCICFVIISQPPGTQVFGLWFWVPSDRFYYLRVGLKLERRCY